MQRVRTWVGARPGGWRSAVCLQRGVAAGMKQRGSARCSAARVVELTMCRVSPQHQRLLE